jgi:hypothetical protein
MHPHSSHYFHYSFCCKISVIYFIILPSLLNLVSQFITNSLPTSSPSLWVEYSLTLSLISLCITCHIPFPKPFLIEQYKFYKCIHQQPSILAKSEVLTQAVMKMKFLLDTVSCRFVKSYRSFGGACCLHLQVL